MFSQFKTTSNGSFGKGRLQFFGKGAFLCGEVDRSAFAHFLQEQVRERVVGQDIVTAADEFNIVGGAGHEGSAFGNIEDACVDLVNLVAVRRGTEIPDLRIGRDDVGRLAAAGDYRVDSGFWNYVLAQVVDSDIHENDAVQGATSQIGRAAGMGGDAVEIDFEGVHGMGRSAGDDVGAAGMPGEGGVEIVEDAVARHVGFAYERLFGRAAVETDGTFYVLAFHGRF